MPNGLRKRVAVALGPTEDPVTFIPTVEPAVGNLASGIRLIRVEPNYITGLWMAILDVTDAADQDAMPWWAPGISAPVLLPRASVEAANAANAPKPASKIQLLR